MGALSPALIDTSQLRYLDDLWDRQLMLEMVSQIADPEIIKAVRMKTLPEWPNDADRTLRVHVNRTLNLRTIKAIGYDMDYTLVGYQAAQWEERAYAYLKGNLVEAGWDTPEIRALEFDAERAIRGLIVDQELGNLLKVNRFAYVKQARHGLEPIAFDAFDLAAYGTSIDLTTDRFVQLDTLFSLSEGCIFSQLVDLFDRQGLPGVYDYRGIWRAVRKACSMRRTSRVSSSATS